MPQRRLGDMLIGLTMKGNQSRTTDFAELEQCCRTTYGHFLSAGKWDEGKVSEKQQQEVFRVASQLAVESKEEFWRRYQEGDTPRTIMYDLGYDPEALGRNRLSGIQNAVCKQAVSAKGFQERPQSRRGEDPSCGGTIYLCTADGEGNMVSWIQSNYTTFGAGVAPPAAARAPHSSPAP